MKEKVIPLPRPHEPAPAFTAQELEHEKFNFYTVAGRYIVLFFFGSRSQPESAKMLDAVLAKQDYFDDYQASFFGVTVDKRDISADLLQTRIPGIRYFKDFDLHLSKLYGAVSPKCNPANVQYNPVSYVLDPALRIVAILPVESAEAHAQQLFEVLEAQPAIEPSKPGEIPPPVLIVPRIFEPEFCRRLIDYFDEHEPEDSGFMTEKGGKTVLVVDHSHKRRSDCLLADTELRDAVRSRILRRLVPEIKKAFEFRVTRMERYLLACYSGDTGGYFSSHRDNTTKGTAHRRFAVSLALNTGEYKGGGLQLPEYNSRVYNAPTGGALVFSCSLQHRALAVREGKRYMFLPFLYDDTAAQLREANLRYLDPSLREDPSLGNYRAVRTDDEDDGAEGAAGAGTTAQRRPQVGRQAGTSHGPPGSKRRKNKGRRKRR